MEGFLAGALTAEEYELLDRLGTSKLLAASVAISDENRSRVLASRGGTTTRLTSVSEEGGPSPRVVTQTAEVLAIPGPEYASDEEPKPARRVTIDAVGVSGGQAGRASDPVSVPGAPPDPMARLRKLREQNE